MAHVLDEKLRNSFDELEISSDQRQSLRTYLRLIKAKDVPTWEHSVRVGLKGKEVLEYAPVVHPKALFYSGLLHDVGKALTDLSSLTKTEGFDDKDMKELQKHPFDGYRILKGIHDFSAEVLLRHHTFPSKGYPKNLPHADIDFSKGSEAVILYCARVLGLIDFYDAVTHRENDKFSPGTKRLPTPEEAKKILLDANKDQAYLIKGLYDKKIF